MVLDKYCPVSPADWEALIEFLGAGDGTQFGGRNRYHCRYVIYTDGTNFFAEDGTTGKIAYGGPNNEPAGTVNGADAAAVIQAALNGLTAGRTSMEKVVIKGDITIGTQITVPSYTEIAISGVLRDVTDLGGILLINKTSHIRIHGGLMVGVNGGTYVGIRIQGDAVTQASDVQIDHMVFHEFYYGIQIRTYFEDIDIAHIRGEDCIFVVGTIMGVTNGRRVTIDDVIGRKNDGTDVRYAVSLDAGTTYGTISNVIGYKSGSIGLASVKHVTVTNAISIGFEDLIRPAVNIETTPTYVESVDIECTNLSVYDCAYIGIRVGVVTTKMTNVKLVNCYVESAGDAGYHIYNVREGQFINCEAVDSTLIGFEVFGNVGPLGIGELQFTQCRADAGLTSGWYFNGTKAGYVELLECIGSNNTANGLIFAPGAMTGVRVLDGRWEGNATAVANPANQLFRNNAGFVTENRDTATILNGANTVVVAHGLAGTPDQVFVNGMHAEVESAWADTYGAANFTIHKGGAGNVTADRNVNWSAYYEP